MKRWLNNSSKRILELIVTVGAVVLLAPVYIVIALLIKLESPGPVFYRGLRMGRGSKGFQILKFRTMRESLESPDGPRITARDDERVTPLGRWLRDTKINELPQLWNVLKGEMSLVGPRPEDPEIVKAWPEEVRGEILSVRPGITSPASVLYRHEESLLHAGSVMDEYLRNIMPDKLRLDLLYVRTHSLLSDLDVLLWTVVALLAPLGRKPIQETHLYAGPFTSLVRRYLAWFLVDGAVAFAAIGLVGAIWRLNGPLNLGVGVFLALAAGIALLFSLINSLLGMGRISWQSASPVYVFDLALSSGLATAVVVLIDWVWPSGRFFPPGMAIEAGIFAFFGFVAVRYRQRLITGLASRWLTYRRRVSALGERVLIVGAGECGLLAAWLMQKSNLSTAFSIVGMVDDDPFKQNMRIDGQSVIGTTRQIPALVERYQVGVILFAISRIDPQNQERILAACRELPARLVIIPDLVRILQETLDPALGQAQVHQPAGRKVKDDSLV